MTNIRAALRLAQARLCHSESADLDAQLLLARALDKERVFVLAHGEEALDSGQIGRLETLLKRRAAGEPMAYITGRKWFYDLEFLVTPAVLIPRPETELLLEEALRLMAGATEATVADIGTGSGALAVTFARHLPGCKVYAGDASLEALNVARANAELHGTCLSFLHGDLAEPLRARGIRVDLLMANLPYIPTAELKTLAVSRFEPKQALDGGADGLSFIRRLLPQIPQVCRDGAWVLLEIGADQGAAVRQLARRMLGLDCAILPDYAGHDRIVRFQYRQAAEVKS